MNIYTVRKNGQLHLATERIAGEHGQVRGAHPHARPGRSRQDYHIVQTEAERDGVQYTDHRFQRGDGDSRQGGDVHGVGRRRAGQDSAALEALLPQHGGPGVRGGQRRSRTFKRGQGGAVLDTRLGRDGGRSHRRAS